MSLKNLAVAAVFAVSFNAFAAEPAKAEPAKAAPAKAEPAKADPVKDAKAAAAAVPTLPPEGKRWVESQLGTWKSSDVTMTMGDKTFKGKMSMKCEKTSDGWGAICKGKADMGKEMPPQDMTMLLGWNIGEGMATMFEVTNMGEVHHHSGKWTDDKNITVTHTGKNLEGKDETDAMTFSFPSAKEMLLKAEGTSAGAKLWAFAATAKK